MKTRFITMMTLLCVAAFSLAAVARQTPGEQQNRMKIKIVDRRGKPVQGIVIQPTESASGITDAKGEFVYLRTSDNDSVNILIPGINTRPIATEALDSILITLRKPSNTVYNTYPGEREMQMGYGTIRERDRTTPSSQIDVQELLTRVNVNSLFELLQGRVAGLDISPRAGGYTTTIRGVSSFYGSNEPLVILDGMPIESLQAADAMVNVRDIKTVDVLKDGSIYGSRGANGVIIIRTK